MFILFACGLFTVGCATFSTTFDVDLQGEFDRYQTFYCQECVDDYSPIGPQYDNELNRERMRTTIREELENRGYIYEQESPDLMVDFHFVIEQRTDLARDAYPMSWQTHDLSYYPIHYKYGTLVVHLVDNNKNQLVWQGTAACVLDNPDKVEKKLQKAVIKIFRQFRFSAN